MASCHVVYHVCGARRGLKKADESWVVHGDRRTPVHKRNYNLEAQLRLQLQTRGACPSTCLAPNAHVLLVVLLVLVLSGLLHAAAAYELEPYTSGETQPNSCRTAVFMTS